MLDKNILKINNKIFIEKYKEKYCYEVISLFYNTIHSINIKDYSKKQVDVWASKNIDIKKFNKSLLENFSIVAIKNDMIVGFGDINIEGYLDRLYVHKNYQRKGIGTLICDNLEKNISYRKIITHSSITAKPFFKSRNYIIMKKQYVKRNNIYLKNYVMEKYL